MDSVCDHGLRTLFFERSAFESLEKGKTGREEKVYQQLFVNQFALSISSEQFNLSFSFFSNFLPLLINWRSLLALVRHLFGRISFQASHFKASPSENLLKRISSREWSDYHFECLDFHKAMLVNGVRMAGSVASFEIPLNFRLAELLTLNLLHASLQNFSTTSNLELSKPFKPFKPSNLFKPSRPTKLSEIFQSLWNSSRDHPIRQQWPVDESHASQP